VTTCPVFTDWVTYRSLRSSNRPVTYTACDYDNNHLFLTPTNLLALAQITGRAFGIICRLRLPERRIRGLKA